MEKYDLIILGSGPAGLGAAFAYCKRNPEGKVLVIEKERYSTGGLRNDCKMNFTFPIGFPEEYWEPTEANRYLSEVIEELQPHFMEKSNLSIYEKRAEKLGVKLVEVRQSHLGTDGGLELIKELMDRLKKQRVEIHLEETAQEVHQKDRILQTDKGKYRYEDLVIAPGRKGFAFLQDLMRRLKIPFMDHILDVGLRLETTIEQYPIVKDYYDPKFLFPDGVRTFCTNSFRAYVVQEKYHTSNGETYYSVNGHAYSTKREANGLVNFALLKTVMFTEPLASGQKYAEMIGLQAMLLGGGRPIMQRVGDFRLGKRSTEETFTGDLYFFEPTLHCTPGDISLSIPAKILRAIWKAMKLLDTIVPGVLHPSTIMYYPEIKLYGNKPTFIDPYFQALPHLYLIGDGAGTSRGITAAWASGIRAVEGILGKPIV